MRKTLLSLLVTLLITVLFSIAYYGINAVEKKANQSSDLASTSLNTSPIDAIEFPATCFAPGTDPEVMEEYYNYKYAKANSLGLTEDDMLAKFNILNRWGSTATNGGGLSQGDITTLTWSYVADGTPIANGGCGVPGESTAGSNFITFFNGIYGPPTVPGDFTTAPWHALFVNMFDTWSQASGLIFVYEPNDDGVSVVLGGAGALGVRGDIRISGRPLDGNNGVLACNYFPNIGDMIIDTSDSFYANNPGTGTINVLTHEIGHGLGIAHVCPVNQTKLMEPFVSLAFQGPQEDDILATNRSYGDPDGVNDTSGTATFLGSTPNPVTYNRLQRSIDDNSDVDYFSFTVNESSSIEVILTPTGSNYLSGVQNTNGSCTPGTPFNALTVSDLMVEVIGTNGTSVLATGNSNGAGVAETIFTNLPIAGTYYIRVQQQGTAIDNVQMYDLTLNLNADTCTTASVPTNVQASTITDTSAFISWDAQSGVIYNLRYREVGSGTWNLVEDIASPNYTISGLTQLTQFEVQVQSKCPGDTPTAFSPSIFFTTEQTILVYCPSFGNSQDDEYIGRVVFATIDNVSADENGGYSDFTSISTNVVSGGTYGIEITPVWTSTIYPEGYAVWIDYNQNGSFTDPGELVFSQTPTIATPVTGNVTIPATALEGTTRMRVSMKYNGIPTSCENFTWGEVEDYSVQILRGYVYSNGSWMPNHPVTGTIPSTATDNITVLDGTAIITEELIGNNLNVASGATLTMASSSSVVGTVLNLSGDIRNDGTIEFLSNVDDTAQLAEFNGIISGSGQVRVERYIPARRAFRFLSSAVSGVSIADSWQQNTHITGAGGAANGFDPSGSNNPSMFYFDHAEADQANAWKSISTTATILNAGSPYRIMVRGDRSINLLSPDANQEDPVETTLSATGSLATGTLTNNGTQLPAMASLDGQFSLLGNPYQAVVDASQLTFVGDLNTQEIAVWDPNLSTRGAFVSVNISTGSGTPDPSSSAANKYLMPGQSFYVVNNATVNTLPSITFTESAKAPSQTQTAVFSSETYLNLRLYTADAYLSGSPERDAVGVRWASNYTTAPSDEDFGKLANSNENIAVINGNTLLSIDKRNALIDQEEIPLFINNYSQEEYVWYNEHDHLPENKSLYIEDHYLGTSTLLMSGEAYAFSVQPNIPQSTANTRFSIRFTEETLRVQEASSVGFTVYPNPVNDQLFFSYTSNANLEKTTVEIFDLLGKKVLQRNIEVSNSNTSSVNITELPSGVYMVRLQLDDTYLTKKIIKM